MDGRPTRRSSPHLVVALKKPHVHTRTSGIENPVLPGGFRTGKKLIFFSRQQLASYSRDVAPAELKSWQLERGVGTSEKLTILVRQDVKEARL